MKSRQGVIGILFDGRERLLDTHAALGNDFDCFCVTPLVNPFPQSQRRRSVSLGGVESADSERPCCVENLECSGLRHDRRCALPTVRETELDRSENQSAGQISVDDARLSVIELFSDARAS